AGAPGVGAPAGGSARGRAQPLELAAGAPELGLDRGPALGVPGLPCQARITARQCQVRAPEREAGMVDERAEERPALVQPIQVPSRSPRVRSAERFEGGPQPEPGRQPDPGLRPGKDPGDGPQIVDRATDLEPGTAGGSRPE